MVLLRQTTTKRTIISLALNMALVRSQMMFAFSAAMVQIPYVNR